MKVILLVGPPASGKSTFAESYVRDNADSVIVCRDDIRAMQGFGEIGNPEQERLVTKIQNGMIEIALAEGRDVVVANTNINKQQRRNLIKLAHEHGADVEVKLFTTDYDECVRRNAARSRVVPENIIRKMYDSMQAQISNGLLKDEFIPCPRWAVVKPDDQKTPATVIDIDGTVAKHNRSPYDYSLVSTDSPIQDVIDVVRTLSIVYKVIFVSGRPDSCRADTLEWLDKHYGMQFDLYMRSTGDSRPDYVVKNEIWDEHILSNYRVVMAFDDRAQVTRHIRSRGVTVAQMDFGRF